jgi:hypothetical protein
MLHAQVCFIDIIDIDNINYWIPKICCKNQRDVNVFLNQIYQKFALSLGIYLLKLLLLIQEL